MIIDLCLFPVTIVSALLFRYFRKKSLARFPIAKKVLLRVGVFPIFSHYYEPLFDKKHLRYSLRSPRNLPGIDLNDVEQLEILRSFDYNGELLGFPIEKTGDKMEYCYNFGAFLSGDAEYLYSMIRHFKPQRLIEVGSGNSTLMARNAIEGNRKECATYVCQHVCIEPYEQGWLEQVGVAVIRKKVEELPPSFFDVLQGNDILFIDSSHMIRPQGDVLFEYLELLPRLNKGVIVHIHDIFTPRDYLDEWVGENFWNEQYLLEAFLTLNRDFRIIGATNYLSHNYREIFCEKCPVFKVQKGREPGSFWIVRN